MLSPRLTVCPDAISIFSTIICLATGALRNRSLKV